MSLFNNITGTFATNISKGLVQGVKQSIKDLGVQDISQGRFMDFITHSHSSSHGNELINLTDMSLSPGELAQILQLREAAQANGASEFVCNLKNKTYSMNVESFDMKQIG